MSLKIPPSTIQPNPQLNQPNSNPNPSQPQTEIQAEEPTSTKRKLIPAPIPDPTITLRLRTSTNLLPTQGSPAAPASVYSVYPQGSFQLGTQLVGPWGFHPARPAQPLPQLCSSRRSNPTPASSSTPPQQLLSLPALKPARCLSSSSSRKPQADSTVGNSSSKKHLNAGINPGPGSR